MVSDECSVAVLSRTQASNWAEGVSPQGSSPFVIPRAGEDSVQRDDLLGYGRGDRTDRD